MLMTLSYLSKVVHFLRIRHMGAATFSKSQSNIADPINNQRLLNTMIKNQILEQDFCLTKSH